MEICTKQKKKKILNKEIKCISSERHLNGCSASCQKQFSMISFEMARCASIVQLSNIRSQLFSFFPTSPLGSRIISAIFFYYSWHYCLHSIRHQRCNIVRRRDNGQRENVVAWKNIPFEHCVSWWRRMWLSSISLMADKFHILWFHTLFEGLSLAVKHCKMIGVCLRVIFILIDKPRWSGNALNSLDWIQLMHVVRLRLVRILKHEQLEKLNFNLKMFKFEFLIKTWRLNGRSSKVL